MCRSIIRDLSSSWDNEIRWSEPQLHMCPVQKLVSANVKDSVWMVRSRGVGPSTTLAWPGWKQPDIPVEVDTARLKTSRTDTVKELPGYSVQNSPSGNFLSWGGACWQGGNSIWNCVNGMPQKETWTKLRTPFCSYPIIVSHLRFNFLCLLLLYSIYLCGYGTYAMKRRGVNGANNDQPCWGRWRGGRRRGPAWDQPPSPCPPAPRNTPSCPPKHPHILNTR